MDTHRKPRRRHSAEFKSQVVEACNAPGASIAGVALSFGVSANLVHQWRKGCGLRHSSGTQPPSQELAASPAFIPLALPSLVPEPAAAPVDIRIEVRCNALHVNVAWPCTAAADCAAWLRELLR